MRKAFIPWGGDQILNWMGAYRTPNLKDADFLALNGGTDINPAIYKHRALEMTDIPDNDRDLLEINSILEAVRLKKPIVGTCRGAQLLCAMAGGVLIQHQSDEPNHEVITSDGSVITVASSHHQAAYPWPIPSRDFKLLGWCREWVSAFHLMDKLVFDATRPEVEDVYYRKINALAIQSHPEWIYNKSYEGNQPTINHYRGLLEKLFDGSF